MLPGFCDRSEREARMARRSDTPVVEWKSEEKDECVWYLGFNKDFKGNPSSDSYNSCVGLVLWSGAPYRGGVVAHYAGGLGNDLTKVETDTLEILNAVNSAARERCKEVDKYPWKAWVFGGINLKTGGEQVTGTMGTTGALIDKVRETISGYKELPIEENVYTKDKKIGHKAVELDLLTGTIKWDHVAPLKRSNSSGDIQKTVGQF
jgi:hypothetical protein